MTRLNLLFELFEQIVSQDRFGHCFANQGQHVEASLPIEYTVFVTAEARYLPSNWVFYSFFGYETASLDQVRAEMIAEGLPERWLVFGKTGDEDYLVFDRASLSRSAVVWCDADAILQIATLPYYADSFAEAIAKITRSMATAQRQSADQVIASLDALSLGKDTA